MGMQGDEDSPPLKGQHVPRALATTAVVRCNNMLDDILRQVVIVGGVATRESGFGLYELMHAVTDSFSYAHTERKAGTHRIDFLRVSSTSGPSPSTGSATTTRTRRSSTTPSTRATTRTSASSRR